MKENLLKIIEKVLDEPKLADMFLELESLEDMHEFLQKFESDFTIEELEYVIDEITKVMLSNANLEEKKLLTVTGGNKMLGAMRKFTGAGMAALSLMGSMVGATSPGIETIPQNVAENVVDSKKVSENSTINRIVKKLQEYKKTTIGVGAAVITSPWWGSRIRKLLIGDSPEDPKAILNYKYPIVVDFNSINESKTLVEEAKKAYGEEKKPYLLIVKKGENSYEVLYFNEFNHKSDSYDFDAGKLENDILESKDIDLSEEYVYEGNEGMFERIKQYIHEEQRIREEKEEQRKAALDETTLPGCEIDEFDEYDKILTVKCKVDNNKAEEIVEYLNGKANYTLIFNKEAKTDGFSFINKEINADIIINGAEIGNYTFCKATIGGNITINNATVGDYAFSEMEIKNTAITINSGVFENGTFSSISSNRSNDYNININGDAKFGDSTFAKISINGKIVINGDDVQFGEGTFNKAVINSNVDLKNAKFGKNTFWETEFNSNINAKNSKFGDNAFWDSVINIDPSEFNMDLLNQELKKDGWSSVYVPDEKVESYKAFLEEKAKNRIKPESEK